MQIYAATNRDDAKKRGWIREVPVADVARWAKEFLEFVDAKYPQIPKDIQEKKRAHRRASRGGINKAITEFNGLFQPTPAKT